MVVESLSCLATCQVEFSAEIRIDKFVSINLLDHVLMQKSLAGSPLDYV